MNCETLCLNGGCKGDCETCQIPIVDDEIREMGLKK